MLVFETDRLLVRIAEIKDAELHFDLWTSSAVMRNIGFPDGLPISIDDVRETLREQTKASEFGRNLVVVERASGDSMGECKMYRPDEQGISRTDIKLLPKFWGQGFGVEIKRALIAYIFENTESTAIEATPNIENSASIRMQESVGGIRVGEDTHHFPESMKDYTTPVYHYIYRVFRADWEGAE